MENKFRRLLSFVVAVVMVLSMAPFDALQVFAVGEQTTEYTRPTSTLPEVNAIMDNADRIRTESRTAFQNNRCPICGEIADGWTPLEGPLSVEADAKKHIYLESKTYTNGDEPMSWSAIYMKNNGAQVCLLLTGNATIAGRIFVSSNSTLNIMSDGDGSMHGTGLTGSNGLIQAANGGKINIYGGTFTRANTNAANSSAYRYTVYGESPSTINIYNDVVIGPENRPETQYQNVRILGNFNMYGGTIRNGNTAVTYRSANLYFTGSATVNMYAGTIIGGKAVHGGNVVAGTGTTFTIYNGLIDNGTATTGEAYGGNIYCNGILTMHGGTISNGHAKSGGNIYTGAKSNAVISGTVSGGVCTNQGGNIYALGALTLDGASVSGGANSAAPHDYSRNIKAGPTLTLKGNALANDKLTGRLDGGVLLLESTQLEIDSSFCGDVALYQAGHEYDCGDPVEMASCTGDFGGRLIINSNLHMTNDRIAKPVQNEAGNYELKIWHAPQDVAKQDSTCTAEGHEAGKKCRICNEVIEGLGTIDKKPHALTKTEAKDSTCTETGNIDYWTCNVCNKIFRNENGTEEIILANTIIPAKNHSFTNYIYNNDATCNADGTKTAQCDNECGEKHTITAEGTMLPADAKIGNTRYATLADAIAAANDNDTVVLIRDVTLTEAVNVNKAVTIDLDSKALAGELKLEADATVSFLQSGEVIEAPAGVTVTTDVNDHMVAYQNGVYSVVIKPLDGSGTEDAPYQINSLNDLIKFRDSVNAGEDKYNASGKYIVLADNIDLSSIDNWEPIGTAEHPFVGSFNGQEFKIMNLQMSDDTAADANAYLGFFGLTENNTIKNFIIENVEIQSAGKYVAAAIAYPVDTVVENITVQGEIKIEGGDYTAGVLAYIEFNEDAENFGVGQIDEMTKALWKANNLTVFGNDGSYITGKNVVGGVIANVHKETMNGNIAIGDLSIENVTIEGEMHVGGIAGTISSQTLDICTVKNVTLVCEDPRVGIAAGSMGEHSNIANVTAENVTGATAIIGGTYETGAPIEAVIGNKYYFETFEEAVNAAQYRNVIKLLCDAEGPSLTITKRITIDFNGHTYTLTGAGSNTSIGIEILPSEVAEQDKGKSIPVELKNGTLKVADSAAEGYAVLIENNTDLKIRAMTLDGTNLKKQTEDRGDARVVSINSGRAYFIGNVQITTNANDDKAYGIALCGSSVVDIPDTVLINGNKPAAAVKENKLLAVARAGKIYFPTLQTAVDTSGSIVLIRNVEGPGVEINKDVSINFSGFTYSITEPVESAGFRITAGNRLRVYNGTLMAAADTLEVLIENNGDLIVDRMTLDSGKAAVLANNGNAEISENTIINNKTAIQLGKKYYATLAEAIAARDKASSSDELVLLRNIVIEDTLTVKASKAIALNLNGFTISMGDGGEIINESKAFTIKGNGKITGGHIENRGRMTVTNGIIESGIQQAVATAALQINGGTVSTISITAGALTFGTWATAEEGATVGQVSIAPAVEGVSVNINNGTFTSICVDNSVYTAAFRVNNNQNIIINNNKAVKLGANYYATLAEAIAVRDKASSKDEIVLLGDIVLEKTLTVSASKAIVLDLNGHTITMQDAGTIVNMSNSFTIKDGEGGGKITGGHIENKARMIVTSGIIESGIQQAVATAALQINGGTVSTIRIAAGALTFGAWATTDAGATVGQVSIAPAVEGVSVNINNGSFGSIDIDNSAMTVAFRVNNGTFTKAITCENAVALKGAIRAGSFTEEAINTNATLFHKNFVNK